MADRLASGAPPWLSVPDAQARGLYDAKLIGTHGTQELWHFWLFPLCVAPFLWITRLLAMDPIRAFTALNVAGLLFAWIQVKKRAGPLIATFLLAGPILWWADKAQVDVFTYVCLVCALCALDRPVTAALWCALAGTQNPPIGALSLVLFGYRLTHRSIGFREAFVWLVSLALLFLHPAYYWWRLDRWTALVETGDARLPGLRAMLAVLFDLNIGLVVNAPLASLALLLLAIESARRRQHLRLQAFGIVALGIFLLSFAQAPNVNSGGTPGISRYATWLLPLALCCPAGAGISRRRFIRPVVFGSVLWSLVFFAPWRPEEYLTPTRVAAFVWSERPSWDNPLPEIFAERMRHRDQVNTLAATPNCAKALLQGGQWPVACPAFPVPETCAAEGVLCYANRTKKGYEFRLTSRRGGWRIKDLLRF